MLSSAAAFKYQSTTRAPQGMCSQLIPKNALSIETF